MKRFLILLFLLGCLAPFSAHAAGPAGCEAVLELEHAELDDACAMLEGDDSSAAAELMDTIALLRRCEGAFFQEKSSANAKSYRADVTFYLKYGKPWCSICYTNYMGTIGDAAVEASSEEGYLLHAEPAGRLYSREQAFCIDLSEEFCHIVWGDSCDYLLDRGTGAASDYENGKDAFEDTPEYDAVAEAVDGFFAGNPHHCRYDEKTGTFYAYFVVHEGIRDTILLTGDALRDNVDALIESMKPFSAQMGICMSLSVRESIADLRDGHFAFVWVDRLKEDDDYTRLDDIVFEITDGEVTYNLMDLLSSSYRSVTKTESTGTQGASPVPAPAPSSRRADPSPSYSSGATTGQKNALAKAKDYLSFMAFSYTGLVEQLEYEGYSHSEAVYAADRCGADWNQQAADKAEDYLELMPFSRDGLIEQLEYEGFTHSQAVYGVSRSGY